MLNNEWRVVPDIWRSSAEKYGDIIAVMDPYHDPPTNLTYKQVFSSLISLYISLVSLILH